MKKPKRKPSPNPQSKARISLRVQPNASKDRIVAKLGDAWKISLTAPPVEGRANRACIRFLAELLGVSRSAVRIVRGEASRQKIIEVDGLSAAEAERRLAAAKES